MGDGDQWRDPQGSASGSGEPSGDSGRTPSSTRTSMVEAIRELFPEAPTPPLSDLAMVPGRTKVTEQYQELLTAARQEVLVFDRPPYAWAVGVPNPTQLAAARRVSIRILYERSQLERDGSGPWHDETAAYAAAGVVGRVVDDVSRKLVVVDRRVAMVSLVHPALPKPPYPVTVLVENEAFAVAQAEVFERLWETSAPFLP